MESALERRLMQVEPDGLLTSGVSPHAAYSVSPELFRKVADLARRRGLRLATHVAETMPELEFLQSGGGEFRDFLVSLNALPGVWAAQMRSGPFSGETRRPGAAGYHDPLQLPRLRLDGTHPQQQLECSLLSAQPCLFRPCAAPGATNAGLGDQCRAGHRFAGGATSP